MIAAIDIPVVETGRLRLRGWREADVDGLLQLLSDNDNAQFIGPMASRVEVWRRMATMIGHWSLRGYGTWAVTMAGDDTCLGWAGPWYPEGFSEREIGWALVRSAQGKGVATEAALAARTFAYTRLGWTTAVSFIDPANQASARVAERLGAVRDGISAVHGKTVDVWRHPPPSAADSGVHSVGGKKT